MTDTERLEWLAEMGYSVYQAGDEWRVLGDYWDDFDRYYPTMREAIDAAIKECS